MRNYISVGSYETFTTGGLLESEITASDQAASGTVHRNCTASDNNEGAHEIVSPELGK